MYDVNNDHVASIPAQVESYKHLNQDLYAKWMGTSLIVKHDDELTYLDHHQYYAAHQQSLVVCALCNVLWDVYFRLE